jgi:NADPH:quinone reductase-like Zn-dependent oxidoreductase
LSRLIDAGIIRTIVEAVLPLERAREAYERGIREHPRGKLVLEVASENGGMSTARPG